MLSTTLASGISKYFWITSIGEPFRLLTEPIRYSSRFVGCSDVLGRLAGFLNQLEELICSKYGNKLPRELAYWLIVLDVNPVIHAAHKTHSLS
jgi:hypothetical protein